MNSTALYLPPDAFERLVDALVEIVSAFADSLDPRSAVIIWLGERTGVWSEEIRF